MSTWYCRICGLDYDTSPWGPDERTPDYTICDCCGVSFGYEDYTPAAARQFRVEWLRRGAPWFCPRQRPADWDLAGQLAQVPPAYQ
ncbi:hypothetical protein [Hymenobacter weizhouensis]|uniref:hypothetical protein n=1 Tax=Hymenobacter sp. YIM 151500-1 TaxID=2987689 RepID=UPI002226BB84|nr:hypothetical protein [Hymenobacter sp. YIM 151500-1]UYZ63572.1 hypothetical protein OIS53_01715 [Hymenobacter sp. YIM 151500-1]